MEMFGGRLRSTSVRNRRGAALVEFAIVAILLFTLVFGMIDFGLALHDYLALNQVAREAARSYALGGIPQTAVDTWAQRLGLPATGPNAVVGTYTIEGPAGATVAVVQLDYVHDMICGGFLGIPNLPLRATMVMRTE